MEIATKDESSNYAQVLNPEEGSAGSSTGSPPEIEAAPLSITCRVEILLVGLIASSPTLLLICLGSRPSFASIAVYIGLLLSPAIFVNQKIQSGVARWFLGFIVLFLTSAWKSGQLLATCDNMAIKGVLYAITALWECSNSVLVIAGEDLVKRCGIKGSGDIIWYCLAPCQVKFVHAEPNTLQEGISTRMRNVKRLFHITFCSLGAVALYNLLGNIHIRSFVTAFILLELEYTAIMASMAVVALNIPSYLWQLIQSLPQMIPLFSETTTWNSTRAQVVLPYGWVYSSTSTRVFWSRWSRPATQLLRHLFFHPLGGRDRWYISIPVMFLLNASSHFDLSFALVGERSEVYWVALFGTMAAVAMLELVGDSIFVQMNSDGATEYPVFYWYTRAFVAQCSIRAALYIMIHLCLKTSLNGIATGEL